jgi:Ca2+-binding RTX toxin-like protein
MTIIFHSPIGATYGEFRYSLVKQVEGAALQPYINSIDTFATIGVGLQFETVPGNRDAVFAVLGIGEQEAEVRQQLRNVITTAASTAALQSGLDAIMAQRALSISGARTEFAFANDQEMREAFNIVAPGYELQIEERLSGVVESRERAVLYSLSHNNPSLLGNNLMADISNVDRAEAFFEIRYASNGGAGHQEKRRYVESQIFGVFDNANPISMDDVSAVEALSAFKMWTRHEEKITTYDSTHSAAMTLADADLAVIGDNYGDVAELATTLRPAKERLFYDYADINNFEDGLLHARLITSGYAGALLRTTIDSVWVAATTSAGGVEVAAHTVDRSDVGAVGDLIFGSVLTDGTDSGAEDTLLGGDGDDFFVGSGGADTISGGAGEDTVSYARSGSAVTIDLTSGGAQSGGDAEGDHLSGIENVIGSAYLDHITLGDGSHVVEGSGWRRCH